MHYARAVCPEATRRGCSVIVATVVVVVVMVVVMVVVVVVMVVRAEKENEW